MIANQVRRAATRAGGGAYLPSCIRAYEFNEVASPVVDSINGFQAVLGSAMTVGSGVLNTTDTASNVNTAVTNDTAVHVAVGTTTSFEWYGTIGSSASWVVLFSSKGDTAGLSYVFAGSKLGGAYDQFFFANTNSRAQFNEAAGGYVTDAEYHFVLTVDGEGNQSDSTLFINGVKFPGTALGNLGATTQENSFGFNGTATGAETHAKFFRVYNKILSDVEAAQLYTNRDIEP